jgi:hypothetical protein
MSKKGSAAYTNARMSLKPLKLTVPQITIIMPPLQRGKGQSP